MVGVDVIAHWRSTRRRRRKCRWLWICKTAAERHLPHIPTTRRWRVLAAGHCDNRQRNPLSRSGRSFWNRTGVCHQRIARWVAISAMATEVGRRLAPHCRIGIAPSDRLDRTTSGSSHGESALRDPAELPDTQDLLRGGTPFLWRPVRQRKSWTSDASCTFSNAVRNSVQERFSGNGRRS